MSAALRLALRMAAAAGCGVAVALAFPPYGWWPVLVPALVGLLATLEGQRPGRAALLGLVFGLAQMLSVLPWVRVIGTDAWLALALLEAVFFAAFGWAVVHVRRLAWWPVAVAALWVLVELGRSEVPFTGFPWGRVAFALVDTPMAPYVRWIGVPALSGLVVLLAAVVWWALLRLRSAPALTASALVAAAAVVAVGAVLPVGLAGPVGTVRVAAVQGGVPGTGADGLDEQRAVVDNHEAATLDYAADVAAGQAAPAEVVIWPENSTDIDPLTDDGTRQSIDRAARAVGVPLLVGALTAGSDDEHLRNVGIVWDPQTGPGQMYVKRNLVPFGEYIPLRDLLAPMFGRLDEIPRDFEAGSGTGVLDLGPVVVGDAMCYDVAFESAVAPSVRDGAELLVVQTNNATYLGTGQPAQQWAISRLRALESGRDLVVASTNGISGFVAADGSVMERTTSSDPVVLTATVHRATGLTLAVRMGAALEWLLSGLALVAVLLGLLASRRERRRADLHGGDQDDGGRSARTLAQAGR